MRAPLHGVRIVDLGWLLPAPMCTHVLADLGADVIKVERPGDGDYARTLLPGLFRLVNRGKRSAVLDLEAAEGRETLLALAATADVFVEGFRPGVVDRLGVGYAAVRERNPRIVYASISGYGQTGPMATQGGHDINFCAQSGLLAIPSTVGQEGPRRMQLPVSDIAGGMYAAVAILAALRQRDAAGEGSHLDVAMADCALAWSGLRWADAPKAGHGWTHVFPGNDLFRTADGRWLAAALVEQKFWRGFRAALHAMGTDPDALGLPERVPPAGSPETQLRSARHALVAAFAEHEAAAWLDAAARFDVPLVPVADSADALRADPLYRERGSWWPDGEGTSLPAFPVKMPGVAAPGPAPALGADTQRIAADPAAAWES